jgi:hypothetical protein
VNAQVCRETWRLENTCVTPASLSLCSNIMWCGQDLFIYSGYGTVAGCFERSNDLCAAVRGGLLSVSAERLQTS